MQPTRTMPRSSTWRATALVMLGVVALALLFGAGVGAKTLIGPMTPTVATIAAG